MTDSTDPVARELAAMRGQLSSIRTLLFVILLYVIVLLAAALGLVDSIGSSRLGRLVIGKGRG